MKASGRYPIGTIVFATLAIGATLLAAPSPSAVSRTPPSRTHATSNKSYEGPPVRIGRGSAHAIVLADAQGNVEAFGIELTADALDGLPTESNTKNGMLEWRYDLQFPKGAPSTGFDHIMIDWNPHGHVPPGVYTVPHFDLHFFLITPAQQAGIHYPHEAQGTDGVKQPSPELMAPGYLIPPGTQINQMGVHAVSKDAPELHGQPFTSTFVYGYHDGALVFVEPMVTRAFLETHPALARPVPVPQAYSFPALYPSEYRIRYDAGRHVYQILLDRLRPWHRGRPAHD